MKNPLFKSITTTATLLLTATALGLTTTDDIDFIDIAPENSFLIVAGDNFSESLESLQATLLWELWETSEIQAFIEKPFQMTLDQFNEDLNLELERDELPFPTGMFGFAIFPGQPDEEQADEEYPEPPDMHYLAACDFGDKAPTVVMLLMDTVIDRLADEEIEVEIDEFEGRLINSAIAPEPDRDAMIEELKEDMGDNWDDGYLEYYDDIGYFDQKAPDVHFVLDDTTLFLCTDRTTIEDILLGIDGEPRETIASNETFEGTMTQVGGRGDFYAAFLLPDKEELLDPFGPFGTVSMMLPASEDILESLGLLNVRALGASLSFDKGSAMVEAKAGLYMPGGAHGLFNLFTESRAGLTAPDWLDPEVQSLTQINFDFKGLVPLIRKTIDAMPEEEREYASQAFETSVAGLLETVCDVIGPQIHIITWQGDTSTLLPNPKILLAIECNDELIVDNTIVAWGTNFGLVPRDFLGYRIFEMQSDFIPTGIGIGKERVYIGLVDIIEQVFRADADSLKLAEEDHFNNAATNLPNEAVLYSFTSIRPYIETWITALYAPFDEEAKAARIEEMRQWYVEMEMEEMFDPENFEQEEPDWYDPETIPDKDLILRFIGDILGHIRTAEDGFIYKTQLLEPIE